MRYARLNRKNRVVEFCELTSADYDALPQDERVALYEAEDPEIDENWMFVDRWYSPDEIRASAYDSNPTLYRNHRIDEINRYRGGIFAAGFEYDSQRFKGEANDQLWMTAFLKLLESSVVQPPVNWITLDNNVHVFETVEDFVAMTTYFFGWAQQITFNLLDLKQQIRDAETREEVDALYEPFLQSMKDQNIVQKSGAL